MSLESKKLFNVAAVVIGRNEGERLLRCLKSLIETIGNIVYVDSGSTDKSIENAKSLGVQVVSLDMSIPFTAARARNEGTEFLLQYQADIDYIQFVDGDCEIQPNWIHDAHQFLLNHSDYAVVCGRRRERFPKKTIYNQLCDIEWDSPIGDVLACGGDALIRVEAFKQVDGYNSALIAGEEPEMCFRLRQKAWKIRRLDIEMTMHDANMTKFSQWWNRARRAGYAYASAYYLHGKTIEEFKRKEVLSISLWAFFIPTFILILSLFNFKYILLVLIYPFQVARLTNRFFQQGLTIKNAFFYALSTVIAKWPQALGMIKFLTDRISGKKSRLIEYK